MKDLVKLISQKFDLIETILTLLFAGGMVLYTTETLKIADFEIAKWTLWISLGGLIVIYWLMSYNNPAGEKTPLNVFIHKLTWLGFAVAVLGILLKLQFSDKAGIALLSGLVAIGISLAGNVYLLIKKQPKITRNIVRAVVISLIALFLYLM